MLPSTAFLVGLAIGAVSSGFLVWAFMSFREKPQQFTRSSDFEQTEFSHDWGRL